MRLTAIIAALLLSTAVAADDKEKEKPKVTEIDTKGLKTAFPETGNATKPATIKSPEELEKNAVVAGAAKELAKKIDFEKQHLLVFAWSGSGGDTITSSIGAGGDKKPIVYVEYIGGKTFDLRQHVRLLAVPKDLKVVIERGR